MMKGLFFEYKAIGATAREFEKIDSLPLVRNDKKSVDQIRIEAQVTNFKRLAEKYCIEIDKVQQKVSKIWMHPYADAFDEEIIIVGKTDFMAPIHMRAFNENNEIINIDYDEAIHDLKLTKSIQGSFADGSSWKYPWTMNTLQAYMYKYITELPFFYWVFDYKPKYEHRIFMMKDDPQKTLEMHEAIRKTAEKLIEFKENGYPEWPFFNVCQGCPLECESRKSIIECQIV